MLATARIAGIMAAKRTPELIPLCHGVALTRVAVDLEVDEPARDVRVRATADAFDRTGVEMEAMVAVERRVPHDLRHAQGHRSRRW